MDPFLTTNLGKALVSWKRKHFRIATVAPNFLSLSRTLRNRILFCNSIRYWNYVIRVKFHPSQITQHHVHCSNKSQHSYTNTFWQAGIAVNLVVYCEAGMFLEEGSNFSWKNDLRRSNFEKFLLDARGHSTGTLHWDTLQGKS